MASNSDESVEDKLYIVFDFETNGVGKDPNNKYMPYTPDKSPLPRPNYPTQLAAMCMRGDGEVLSSFSTLIKGSKRMDPWVERNCTSITVEKCGEEGVPFKDAIKMLYSLSSFSDHPPTLVAHNIAYDWDTVLVPTSKEEAILSSPELEQMREWARYDTMVNEYTKNRLVNGKKVFFFRKIDAMIGPSLSDLAKHCNVPFDTSLAHDAMYDVSVTAKCLSFILRNGKRKYSKVREGDPSVPTLPKEGSLRN